MTVYVNSYKGKLARTVIGRVYVEDKDDWDLPDKTFSWAPGKSLPGFDLSPNGEITMAANMPPRTYQLQANVKDRVRNENAIGTVNVVVKLVPEEAFQRQGALRILLGHGGLATPNDFIAVEASGTSPLERFVNKMNEYLGGNAQIDVFSIKKDIAILQTSTPEVIDVRFSAHGSPYRSSVLLNGLIAQHRSELQEVIGATIVSAGIDMCKFTVCDKGCQTTNNANEIGIVISANQTVIVGVNAWSNDTCTCPVFHPSSSCKAELCLNHGVCHNTYPGFFCECRNDALKGPRCQGTTRTFDGKGYAWFKPVPACTSLNVSFQFMTRNSDGLMLYAGPMGDNNTYGQVNYRDYVIVRLSNGRIEAEMLFNDITPNPVRVSGSEPLNDGNWHTVQLWQRGKDIELVVDRCYSIGASSISAGGLGFLDDVSCRATVRTTDDDERLNVVAPLQVGGLAPLSGSDNYPAAVITQTQSYIGCIRNLYVNGEMYDLASPDYVDSSHSQMGCQLTESVCGVNGLDGGYCLHGECIADAASQVPKCLCDPGYGGDRCDEEITWMQLGSGAFVEYDVKVGLEDKTNDVGILLWPGRANGGNGDLGFGYSQNAQEYVGTYIENNRVAATIDPGATRVAVSPVEVRMQEPSLRDNLSYWVTFSRSPVEASLSVDGVYKEVKRIDPQITPYEIPISQIMLGVQQSQGSNRGFQGCIGTFRWQHISLPLLKTDQKGSSSESVITVKQSRSITKGCPNRATCASLGFSHCGGSFICVDFWKGPFCTCPLGSQALLNEDGTLAECGASMAVSRLGISSPAVILILVCLILLILLVLLMVVYTRRQSPPFEPVRPEDMNRDNLRPYDLEGGGEADNDQYNISNLRKPVIPIEENGIEGFIPPTFPVRPRAPIDDKLNSRIKNLESDPDATAPYDELRIYEDEGDNVSRITFESVESTDDGNHASTIGQEIEKWGPRFSNLADIYGKRE
ncbi:hypothetical protein AB6A40_005048 [Gnathostoma spinigerum]|uniref:Uncharacterized protein n=1 Tax=Gnathostoma spinigerum TaxID=75299 RepID=A0ABD6EJL0_9BILA